MANSDPFAQLTEKMMVDLTNGHPYEALQYVQSFLARKKKTLGQNKTSALVFHGAKLLIENDASSEAGTLLVWFIEDGAGVEHVFNLEDSEISQGSEKYCDGLRLLELLTQSIEEKTGPLVEKVYGPLHILANKKTFQSGGPLDRRLNLLEEACARIFEATMKWASAYKSVSRIGDCARMAKILDCWSNDGYATEKPLFFARAVLQLVSERKFDKASSLIEKSAQYGLSNANIDSSTAPQLSQAVWHFAEILTDLAILPTMPRVDKPKLFGLLMQLYVPLITKTDMRLFEILDKVGSNAFNFVPNVPQKAAPANPMTLLKNMLAGGGGGAGGAPKQEPGMDLNAMMAMLNQMQGK